MGFELRGEAVIAAHDVKELKLVYRALHAMLREMPELMETDFVIELQKFLQERAGEEGVDISIHRDWEAWLEKV